MHELCTTHVSGPTRVQNNVTHSLSFDEADFTFPRTASLFPSQRTKPIRINSLRHHHHHRHSNISFHHFSLLTINPLRRHHTTIIDREIVNVVLKHQCSDYSGGEFWANSELSGLLTKQGKYAKPWRRLRCNLLISISKAFPLPHIIENDSLQCPNPAPSEEDDAALVADLEEDDLKSALGKKRSDGESAPLQPLTTLQRIHIGRLIDEYGDDYQSMFVDTKL